MRTLILYVTALFLSIHYTAASPHLHRHHHHHRHHHQQQHQIHDKRAITASESPIAPQNEETNSPNIQPAPSTALQKRDGNTLDLKDVFNTKYNLHLAYNFHMFDDNWPSIGPRSFARGIEACRAGLEHLQSQGGPNSSPSRNQRFFCGDKGVSKVENGWQMSINPYVLVKAKYYPSWKTVRIAVDSMYAGMSISERLYANDLYLWLPSKYYGLAKWVGMGEKYYVLSGAVRLIWQGMEPGSDQGVGPSAGTGAGAGTGTVAAGGTSYWELRGANGEVLASG